MTIIDTHPNVIESLLVGAHASIDKKVPATGGVLLIKQGTGAIETQSTNLLTAKSAVPKARDLAGGLDDLLGTLDVGVDQVSESTSRRYVFCWGTPACDSPPNMMSDRVRGS